MRFLIAGLAMLVVTSVAAHDETSTHSHDSAGLVYIRNDYRIID